LTVKKCFILIAGISGTGKSDHLVHLREKRGFYTIDTDREWSYRIEEVRKRNVVRHLVDAHGRVAVEWGFNPDDFLDFVREMSRQGARLVWFEVDGDRRPALAEYLKRAGAPPNPKLWYDQVERIQRHGLPTLDFKVVYALGMQGHSPPEVIDREIFPHENRKPRSLLAS